MNILHLKKIGTAAIPALVVGILFTISTLQAANPGQGSENSQGAQHASQTARERADERSVIVDDNEIIFVDSLTGNVGIGTTSPTEALHVVGNIKAEGKIFARAYSSLSPLIFEAPVGFERARIDDVAGNFGIGTPAPQEKLTVAPAGSMAIEMTTPAKVSALASSGGFLSSGTYHFKVVASDGIGTTVGSAEVSCAVDGINTNRCALSWAAVPGASLYRIYKGAVSDGQNLYQVSSANAYDYDKDGGAKAGTVPEVTTAYVNKLSASGASWFLGGNLGIGTTAPSAKLDVAGNVRINAGTNTHLTIQGDTLGALNFRKSGATLWSLNDLSDDFRIDEHNVPLSLQGDPCLGGEERREERGTAPSSDTAELDPVVDPSLFDERNRFIIKKCTGKVGIGTKNPKERLQVVDGGITTDSFFSFSSVQQVPPSDSVYISAPRPDNLGIFTNSAEHLTVGSNGYVGIGTPFPEARLHVKGLGFPSSFLYLDTYPSGQDAGIRFNEAGKVKYHLYNDAYPGVLRIDPDTAKGIAIDKDGKVGLGTLTPAERLDLAGGNIKMGYEIVSHTEPEGSSMAKVSCPAGKKILGGGCGSNRFDELWWTFPYSDTRWDCQWGGDEGTKTAYAICANIR